MINLKVLPIGQKVALTERWLHENRDVFTQIVEITGLIGLVETAHKELVSVSEWFKNNQSTKPLNEALSQVDRQHDQAIRALWYGLEAAACAAEAEHPDDLGRRDALYALRSAILPEGLVWTQRPYLEEIGNVRKAVARLTPAQWKHLEALKLGDTNLAALARRWLALSEKLSDLLNQKVMIDGSRVDGATVQQAQLAWISAVRTVLNVLDVCTAPNSLKERLIKPVATASHEQLQREASQEANKVEAAPDNGVSDPVRPILDREPDPPPAQ